MSNGEEKVIREWPEHLTNEGQKLESLPEKVDTDYVILRFQGKDVNRRFATQVKKFAIDLYEAHPDEFDLAMVTATQKPSKYAPKNAWTVVRGMFDYLMNWSTR